MKTEHRERARKLRREATSAEKLLWARLRNRKLGAKFRRQQCYGPYILDFYSADARLAEELDGGQHDMPEKRSYDQRRSAFLKANGIRVLRFWNSRVRENLDAVVGHIRDALAAPPHPNPLPQGERESESL